MKAHTALVLLALSASVAGQSCDLNTDDISAHCTDQNGCFVSSQSEACCNVITQFQSNLLCHIPLFNKIGELASGEGCVENFDFGTIQGVVCDADGNVVNSAACNAAVDSVEAACRDDNNCMTGEPDGGCCAAMESYTSAGCSNDDYPIAQGDQCTVTTVDAFSSTCESTDPCESLSGAVEGTCQDENSCMSDSPAPDCCVAMQAYNTGSCDNLSTGTGCSVTYTTGSAYSDEYCDVDPCDAPLQAVKEACLDDSECASATPNGECCAAMEAYMDVGGCSGTLDVGDGCTAVGQISTYSETCDLSPCNGLHGTVESACLEQSGDNTCMATSPSVPCCAAIQAYEQQSCSETDYPVTETGTCPTFTTLAAYRADNCEDEPVCNGLLATVQSQCVENECVSSTPSDTCCAAMDAFNSGDCNEDTYSLDLGDNCEFSTIQQFHTDHCNADPGGVDTDCPGMAASILSSCTSGTISVCVDNTPSSSCCDKVSDFIEAECSSDLVNFPNNPLCSYTPDDISAYSTEKCAADGCTSRASSVSSECLVNSCFDVTPDADCCTAFNSYHDSCDASIVTMVSASDSCDPEFPGTSTYDRLCNTRVDGEIGLPISAAQFTTSVRNAFKAAIASTIGVDSSSVVIGGVTESSSKQTTLTVEWSVILDEQTQATDGGSVSTTEVSTSLASPTTFVTNFNSALRAEGSSLSVEEDDVDVQVTNVYVPPASSSASTLSLVASVAVAAVAAFFRL